MSRKSIVFLLVILVGAWSLPASAQQDARVLMRALAQRYAGKKNLSFSVVYRYSKERAPGTYLDSLRGSFEISGDRYKYLIDSTEFLGTKDLSVILFKADRLIYLAKPSANVRSNNPLAMLDSLLWKKDSVESRVEDDGDRQKLILEFRPAGPVKRVEYQIDKRSGLVTRVINSIDSRQLYEASIRSQVQGAITYVIVEADIRDYKENAFPDDELDPGKYVKKTNGGYIAQAPYDSYKIFLATPDL